MHKLTLKLISFGMMALVATTAIRAIPDVQVIPVVYAASIPSSGISGTFPAGGTWSLTSDGTLTLSGDVDNLAKTIPWKNYLAGIKKITGTDVRLIGNCGSMFANCTNLTSFDGTGWDTSKATSMARFFYNCPNLTEAKGIGDWNTSGFTNTAHMFYNCKKLTEIDVADWDMSNNSDIRWMFASCEGVTELDVSKWDVSKVTTLASTFSACKSLTKIPVENWNTSNVTDMSTTFQSCSKITSLDLSKWKTDKVTTMKGMFSICSLLTSIDMTGWNTGNIENFYGMFQSCIKLPEINCGHFDTHSATTMAYMFSGCYSVPTLPVSDFDTSNVTDISHMFQSCTKLGNLDLSSWDVSKVTTMAYTFYSCRSFTDISSIYNWNTSSNTSLEYTFGLLQNIKTMDFSKWDTSNVTTMLQTFYYCNKLTDLDISTWDTKKVTTMSKMFHYCQSIQELDLSSFEMDSLESMMGMFQIASKLVTVKGIKNWDVSNVSNFRNLFYGDSNLDSDTIHALDDWDIQATKILAKESYGEAVQVIYDAADTEAAGKSSTSMYGFAKGYTYVNNNITDRSSEVDTLKAKLDSLYATYWEDGTGMDEIEEAWKTFVDDGNMPDSCVEATLTTLKMRYSNYYKATTDSQRTSYTNSILLLMKSVVVRQETAKLYAELNDETKSEDEIKEIKQTIADLSDYMADTYDIAVEGIFDRMFYKVGDHPDFSAFSGYWTRRGSFIAKLIEGKVVITAEKELVDPAESGKKLEDQEFSFKMINALTGDVYEAKNDADGLITFEDVDVVAGVDYVFYVEEDTSETKDHLEYTDEGLKITFRTDADEEGELMTKNIKTETYKMADLDPFTISYDVAIE